MSLPPCDRTRYNGRMPRLTPQRTSRVLRPVRVEPPFDLGAVRWTPEGVRVAVVLGLTLISREREAPDVAIDVAHVEIGPREERLTSFHAETTDVGRGWYTHRWRFGRALLVTPKQRLAAIRFDGVEPRGVAFHVMHSASAELIAEAVDAK